MDPALYAAFIASVVVLVLVPGPLVALIVANAAAYGTRYGLLTVLGAAGATVVHLIIVALGLTAAIAALGAWFEVLRIAGGAYVVWLGIQAIRAMPADLASTTAQPRSIRVIMGNGFLVALFNPKALLFYAAFFPQFVSPRHAPGPQMAVLCLALLSIGMSCDSAWAVLAGRARGFLARHVAARNRVTGGMLIGAGVLLTMVNIG